MGFFDLHGGLGRRFGSIGLSLDHPETTVVATRSQQFEAGGCMPDKVLKVAREFAERVSLPGAASLRVDAAIPAHAGLGSGTQMALAIGVALARLYDLPLSVRDVAALSQRGARSGIGVGAFESGGLLLDGGRGDATLVPPVIARMDFPEAWRVLLVLDDAAVGVHGSDEISAFQTLPEFPAAQAADIYRHVLMQALPALAEHDLGSFGAAIGQIQALVGDHFAAAQGGGRYTSKPVSQVMAWLQSHGVVCAGQSSWGPTGFAVIADVAQAERLLRDAQAHFADCQGLRFMLCQGRNHGSLVNVTEGSNAGPGH